MGTKRIQGHNEFAGNFRAVQITSEQPKHFHLAFAQGIDQTLVNVRSVFSLVKRSQELVNIVRRDTVFRGLFKQEG